MFLNIYITSDIFTLIWLINASSIKLGKNYKKILKYAKNKYTITILCKYHYN